MRRGSKLKPLRIVDSNHMKKTKTLLLAASLLVPSITLHAENASPAPAISQERIQQENAAAKAQPVNLRGELAGEPIPIINGQFTVPLGAWAPASFVLP